MPEPTDNDAASSLALRAVRLKRRIAQLEDNTKELKKEFDAILRRIPAIFAAGKVDNVKVDGVVVCKRRNVWASKKESTDTHAYLGALRAVGLGDFVSETYSHGRVQSHIQEVERQLQEDGFEGEWEEALREKVGARLFNLMNVTDTTKGVVMGL